MSEKIGIGILSCNRPDFLSNLLKSLEGCGYIDEIIVVNDGDFLNPIDFCKNSWMSKCGEWVNNPANLGVAKSKNKALQHLLDEGCDHIFLIEDDMFIKDETIFDKYIEA